MNLHIVTSSSRVVSMAVLLTLLAGAAGTAQQAPSNPPPPPREAAAPAQDEKDFSKRPPHKPITAPWSSPPVKLSADIRLTSAQRGGHETARTVKGGKFGPDGWQALDRLAMLTVELRDGLKFDEAGAIELEMTNLDFDAQVDGRKQHFFNLFTEPTGNHFVRTPDNNFFTLRGGNYKDKEGRRGIKVLWKGGGERGEAAPFAARPKWDPQATYIWRAEWTNNELVVLLNNERIFGPAEFKDRSARMPLKYVYLSKDGCPNEKVWYGIVGPVYKRIKVYRAAK